MQQGLTKELAIVQGPPGTGKTYIGWQIAKLLLKNAHMWNPDGKHPLLVVCYTNHALDQFLEGILSFQSGGIIRIGGRSKNEALQPFLLNNVRRNHKLPFDINEALKNRRHALRYTETDMNWLAAQWILIQSEIPTWHLIRKYVSDAHQMSLCGGHQVSKHEQVFFDWVIAAEYKQRVPDRRKSVMNPALIRGLMSSTGFSEILCKKAAHWTGNSSLDVTAAFLYQNMHNPMFVDSEFPELNSWPNVQDVDELVGMGFPEQTVVDAFSAVGGRAKNRAVQWLLFNFGQDNSGLHESNEENVPGTSEDPDDLGEFENLEIERELIEDDFDEQFAVITESQDEVLERVFKSSFLDLAALLQPKEDDEGFQKVKKKNKRLGWEYAEELKRKIFGPGCMPMSEALAEKVDDVWSLRPTERWRLLRYWMIQCAKALGEQLREVSSDYITQNRQFKEIRQMGDVEILKRATVLGMTTTGAAKYQGTLQTIQPPIVIMEEAAEVLEAHLITSLSPGCQHIILIGDHKQLRPNPSVYQLAKDYNLNISLFERLIENGFEYSQLALQHRMRPEISRTLMPHFYEDLLDDESVKCFEDIQGMQKNIFFLNHSQPESDEGDTKSHKNRHEAELALGICKYLVQQEYPAEKITILVCYSGQLLEVKKIMKEKFKDLVEAKVQVTVVDNFQGEENDIIILSLVRSNNEGKIGFLKVPNRVCVAMSRARKGFYCVGNFDHLSKNCGEDGLWMKIVYSLKEQEFIGDALPIQCAIHSSQQVIKTSQDFVKFAPEGGCQQPCDTRMECGHTCEKPCHAYDLKHQNMNCTKPCARMCKKRLHKCEKMCYEKCGHCMKPVTKKLQCGHSVETECYKDVAKVICTFPCEFVLDCEHGCTEHCSQPHTTICQVKVDKTLVCGHVVKAPCGQPADKIRCTEKVDKQWPGCEHWNTVECCENPLMVRCPTPCGKPLDDCKHPCKGTCGRCRAGRLHIICKETCTNILVCGHECQSQCGKWCPPCEMGFETECAHSKCGASGAKGKKGKAYQGCRCGEPCPPCIRKCEGLCKHRCCDKACYEPCGLERCMEPCRKELDCKHNKFHRNQLEEQMEEKLPFEEQTKENLQLEEQIEEKLPYEEQMEEKLQLEKQMEEKLQSEEQMEEKLPLEEQMKEKLQLEEQMEEKLPFEEQMEEKLQSAEQMEEKLPLEEQTKENLQLEEQMEEKLSYEEQMEEKLQLEEQMEEKLPFEEQAKENLQLEEQMEEKLPYEEQMEEKLQLEEQMEEKLPLKEQTKENLQLEEQMEEKLPHEEQMEEKLQLEEQREEKLPLEEQLEEKLQLEEQMEMDTVGRNLEDGEIHRCIGVCGEPCLTVCRMCDPEKYEEISEGYEEDAMFIQLPDCKHVMEVREMDHWVDTVLKQQEDGAKKAISMLTCPKCKTPIRTCRRYAQDLKQSFSDIQQVKMKMKSSEAELVAKREAMLKDLGLMKADIYDQSAYLYGNAYEALLREIKMPQDKDLRKQTLTRLQNMVMFLKKIFQYENSLKNVHWNLSSYLDCKPELKKLVSDWFIGNCFHEILQNERDHLLSWIQMNKAAASSFMICQFSYELKRFLFMIKFFAVLQHMVNKGKDLSHSDSGDSLEVVKILYGDKEIKTDVERRLQELLVQMEQRNPSGLAFTNEERVQIVTAVGLDRGHWFKCHRGHIFVTGECGGATEEETACFECAGAGVDSRTGGTNHTLYNDNRLAYEMDEANYPAWSNQANMKMANYDLDFQ